MLAQEAHLFRAFDTLGSYLESQAVRHRDNGLRYGGVARVARHIADERTVDLQAADRKTLEIRKRGVAGAKIVDRDSDTHLLELTQQRDRALGIVHDGALGQLELEPVRLEL